MLVVNYSLKLEEKWWRNPQAMLLEFTKSLGQQCLWEEVLGPSDHDNDNDLRSALGLALR